MKETQQKKLGNQIIRKVISSLAIVFLLSCIGINYFALKQLTTLANDAFENVVFGLQKNIDDSNINFELTDDTMQKEIEGFSSKIDEFADNIKFFSDRMLIVTNSGSKYSYIYGFDKDNTYSMGEEVKNPDSVITQIFETGIYPKNEITIHNLIIERSIDCYFPLTDEKGNTVIIVTNIKLGLIAGLFGLISGVLAVILIVVLAIVKIVIGIVVKAEMVQMTLFSNRIEEISNMEGDLTKRIQIKSNNEFGFMAKNINRLIDTVQTIISKVMETTDFLNRSTKEFEYLMEQTEDNSKTIKHSVDMNKKGIEVRSQSTQMVNTKVIDINDAVEHVASQIEQVAAMADESSSEAKSSQLLMADMNQLINESVQQVNDTSSKVGLLKIQSAQISTVIDSIHNISKQTNLLALNAAIEAARYTKGENGFAVVAEEIRKLASESARQADLIEKLIVGVQDSVDTTQYSMNNTLSIIGRVSENIQVLESQNENIVSTIASVAVMVNEVNKATVAIKTGSDCVKVEVMEISNFYDQNDKAIEEMMNQTINQIGNIQSMSEHMKQMAEVSDQLFEMIHRLKV